MTFKINKPLSDLSVEQKIKEQNFLRGADSHEIKKIDPNDKKKFKEVKVNLNEYEDEILNELSEREQRSRMFILKKIVKKGLREMISQ